MDKPRKRHVVSYENMSEEVAAAFNEKYPRGFNDFLPDLDKYTKPDGTPFYAVTLVIGEDVYLVKIQVETDDLDDLEKWLDEENENEQAAVGGAPSTESGDGDTLPDDNISQYGGEEDTADA